MRSSSTVIRRPRRAVFLDRDGVINDVVLRDGRPHPPASVKSLRILPGVRDSLRRLKEVGFLLIVVSNQPDLARGTRSPSDVCAINHHLLDELPLDEIRVCPHDDADDCMCRKPKPGLLLEAMEHWNIEREHSFLVGDRWRDIGAGVAARVSCIFVDRKYDEPKPTGQQYNASGLPNAVEMIESAINR